VEKDHVFFKYRLKTKLPDNPHGLLQQIERERSMSVMTTTSNVSRPCTRSESSLNLNLNLKFFVKGPMNHARL
jgi:hypothetical protein